MSGSPRRKTPSLSPIRVPTPANCKLTSLRGSYGIIAHPRVRLAVLTDVDILLEPLDPTLFPGIPSSIEVHHGFALEQTRYVTRSSSHHSSASRQKLAQDRNHDPLLRPADALCAQRVVRDRRRLLSRRGALAPGRRLPPPPPQLERERAGDRLWHAPRREPGLRRLGRQPPRRPGDAHQRPGGPHPDLS